jgi:glycosyltransferase involved in cell wall biosynthesis
MIDSIQPPSGGQRQCRVFVLGSFAHSIVTLRMPLIRKIRALGGHVAVGAPMAQFSQEHLALLADAGVPVHDVPVDRHAVMNPLDELKYVRRVRVLVRLERANVFIPYTIKPVVFGTFGARLAGVRRIMPMVTGLGSVFIDNVPLSRVRLVRGVAVGLYRTAFKFADTVYFQNPDDISDLRKLGALGRSTRVDILAGSGIDIEQFAEMPLPETSGGKPRFLMVSRLLADKGLREFAQAARIVKSRHPQVEFALVGPADTNPTAVPIDEVRSWNWITHTPWLDDVRPALAACSVYVLPSYREGTPRSVLEAMATGRPIVSTDAPGCREPVMEGTNGFLVPPRTVEPLAEAMQRFIDRPRLIEEMGAASRRIACEKYDSRFVYDPMLSRMGLLPE